MANRIKVDSKGRPYKKTDRSTFIGCKYWDDLRKFNKKPNKGNPNGKPNLNTYYAVSLF